MEKVIFETENYYYEDEDENIYFNDEQLNDDLDLLTERLFENDEEYVVGGTLDLWNRRPYVAKLIRTKNDFREILCRYDGIKIVTENDMVVLHLFHHDGENILTLRQVNQRGINYIDNHYYDYELPLDIFRKKCFSKKFKVKSLYD